MRSEVALKISHLIVAQVPRLLQPALLARAGHPCAHMEHDLHARGCVVGSSLPCAPIPGQTSQESRVAFQLNFPTKSGDKFLKSLAARRVGEDGDLVLLPCSDIDHCNLVRLAAFLLVEVAQLPHQLLTLVHKVDLWPLLPRAQTKLLEKDASMLERLQCLLCHRCRCNSRPRQSPVWLEAHAGLVVEVDVPLRDHSRDEVPLHGLLHTHPWCNSVERPTWICEQLRRGMSEILK